MEKIPIEREILYMINTIGPTRESIIYKKLTHKHTHEQITLAIANILRQQLVDVLLCPLQRNTRPDFGPRRAETKLVASLDNYKKPKSKL